MQSNTRGSESAREWQKDWAKSVGSEVNRLRRNLGFSAAGLADRTEEVGYPITRGTIAKIESNSRLGKLDIAEVVTLAAALGVAPAQLLYPNLADGPAEVLPGYTVSAIDAISWFAGESELPDVPDFIGQEPVRIGRTFNPANFKSMWKEQSRIELSRRLRHALRKVTTFSFVLADPELNADRDEWADHLASAVQDSESIAAKLRAEGLLVKYPTEREDGGPADD